MAKKGFEFRLCSNGYTYLWKDNELFVTKTGNYITLEQDKEDIVELLNETIEENQKLKETLNLIAEADSYTKENSVKEILRREIKAIDTVAGESADAWNDYCLLSNFFEEQYNELWDNYED